jgi:hypothetical protein
MLHLLEAEHDKIDMLSWQLNEVWEILNNKPQNEIWKSNTQTQSKFMLIVKQQIWPQSLNISLQGWLLVNSG